MTPNAKKWARYWRASVADGQASSMDAENLRQIKRHEWHAGRINPSLTQVMFAEIPKDQEYLVARAYPSVFIREWENGQQIKDGLPYRFHTVAAKVLVFRNGEMAHAGQSDIPCQPLLNRHALWPVESSERMIILGDVAAQDDFLARNPWESGSWEDYREYCDRLEADVCDLSETKSRRYKRSEGVFLQAIEDMAGAIQPVAEMYDLLIGENGEIPLFEIMCADPREPRERKPPSRTMGMRLGHMNPVHPLAPAQKAALSAYIEISKGEALAVNGPPGTGKTTMLQSIVATSWVAPLFSDKEDPLPPVIAACSTNNQAVTNIIESFQSVDEREGDPLAGRWIPDWSSYGAYLASSKTEKKVLASGSKKYPMRSDLERLEIEGAFSQKSIESKYLDNFRKAFPLVGVSTLEACAAHLRCLAKEEGGILERAPKVWDEKERSQAAIDSLGVPEAQAVSSALAKESKALSVQKAADEALNGWLDEIAGESSIAKMFAWLPPIAKGRDARALAYLRRHLGSDEASGSGPENGLFERAKELLDLRAKSAQDDLKNAKSRVQSIANLIAARDRARDEWDTLIKRIREKQDEAFAHLDPHLRDKMILPPDADLSTVDEACDATVRQRIFKIATHYWESRWILLMKAGVWKEIRGAKDPRDEKFLKRTVRRATQDSYIRRAMISPVSVSTFHSMPGNFSVFGPPGLDGKFPRFPHWNFIDLLIVDEAGQVSPEIAACSFALAKKALVVGDALQIEPVWSVQSFVDVGNAKAYGLCGSSEDEKAAFLNTGMSASSGSLIKVAQRASPFHGDPKRAPGMHLYEHRRCDDEIISYCNDLCYDGSLIPMRGEAKRPDASEAHLPALGYARVPGREERPGGGSILNRMEARAIAKWIHDNRPALEKHYSNPNAAKGIAQIVAVVTPYRAQADAIESEIKSLGIDAPITVGTVHSLQGAERPVVIFSPTNSRHSAGKSRFWDQTPNMLNVAASRAKDGFLIFGDMSLFDPSKNNPSSVLARRLFASEDNEIALDFGDFAARDSEARAAGKGGLDGQANAVRVESVSSISRHREILEKAFREAKSEVVTMSPWISGLVIGKEGILDLIKAAAERGVRTLIYTDLLFNTDGGKSEAFQEAIALLEQAGAEVRTVRLVHSKILFCDKEWMCVGSFNWLSAHREGKYARRDASALIEGAEHVGSQKEEEVKALEDLRV